METPDLKTTTTGRKAYSYRGPNTWNHYSNELRSITNKNEFRREINKEIVRDENHPR